MGKKVTALSRRELLRHTATLLGVTAISPEVAAAVMAGAKAEAGHKPRILTAEQMDLVALLTEMILPATDTPGANAAGVHHYVDVLIGDYFAPAHRKHFLTGLADVDERARVLGFRNFVAADIESQQQMAVALDREAYAEGAGKGNLLPFFRELKELTLVGYYTSKIGATMELAYDPIPGDYKCVSYDTLGRAWAT